MKVQDVLAHDWKVGDEIYVVCYSYCDKVPKNKTFMSSKPYKVVKKKIKSIEIDDDCDRYKYISFELVGDEGLKGDKRAYINYTMSAMVNYDAKGNPKSYNHQKFCDNKFLTEDEANKYFENEVEKWNLFVANKMNKNAAEIKRLKKRIEEMEKENANCVKEIIETTTKQ